jgi:8-oxo-dGTP pyrophosphatase MutT (NUDIX family)
MEPKWLVWAREIQATAQTGLAYAKDVYDRQRYERLQQLAAVIMAESAGIDTQVVEGLFAKQRGYATPKVDVRGAVFKNEQILLVQERGDAGRWTLPGGWADVNQSPRECVIAEVREEAGLEVRTRQACRGL